MHFNTVITFCLHMTQSSGQVSCLQYKSGDTQLCMCISERSGDLSIKNVEEQWCKEIKCR